MGLGLGIGIGFGNGRSRESVAPIKYRLIDGPFFAGVCKDAADLFGVETYEINLNHLVSGCHRLIYYDALPVRKSNQSEEEFKIIESKKLAYLDRIRSYPNCQVRDGLTRLRTKSRGQKMSEVLEQKGVDTWIAVDAMKFSLTGLADEIEIFTSDSDLYPVFEAIQGTRTRGTLWYEPRIAINELKYSADRSNAITLRNLADWIGCQELFSGVSHIGSDFEVEGLCLPLGDTQYKIAASGTQISVSRANMGGRFSVLKAKSLFPIVNWMCEFDESLTWKQVHDVLIAAVK